MAKIGVNNCNLIEKISRKKSVAYIQRHLRGGQMRKMLVNAFEKI